MASEVSYEEVFTGLFYNLNDKEKEIFKSLTLSEIIVYSLSIVFPMSLDNSKNLELIAKLAELESDYVCHDKKISNQLRLYASELKASDDFSRYYSNYAPIILENFSTLLIYVDKIFRLLSFIHEKFNEILSIIAAAMNISAFSLVDNLAKIHHKGVKGMLIYVSFLFLRASFSYWFNTKYMLPIVHLTFENDERVKAIYYGRNTFENLFFVETDKNIYVFNSLSHLLRSYNTSKDLIFGSYVLKMKRSENAMINYLKRLGVVATFDVSLHILWRKYDTKIFNGF